MANIKKSQNPAPDTKTDNPHPRDGASKVGAPEPGKPKTPADEDEIDADAKAGDTYRPV